MTEQRFYQVKITREVTIEITVVASTSGEAVVLAEREAPTTGAAWEIRRQRAMILNVFRRVPDVD